MKNSLYSKLPEKYQLLRAKINHVFNKNVDFIFELIFEEATTLPFDNSIYVEKEMNFEIDRQLAMTHITYEFLQDSVLNDYRFLEPSAHTPLEFRALLYTDSRNFAIVKSIIAFREKRVELIESNRIKSDLLNRFKDRWQEIMREPLKEVPLCMSKENLDIYRSLFKKRS